MSRHKPVLAKQKVKADQELRRAMLEHGVGLNYFECEEDEVNIVVHDLKELYFLIKKFGLKTVGKWTPNCTIASTGFCF